MKPVLGLSALVLLMFSGMAFHASSMAREARRLEAENRELRLRDANRARLERLRKGKYDVDLKAVANAAYDMGTPASLLAAMRKQEHGGPVYELGHGGKTALIWECVEPSQIQYYEAARTANKALWAWAWSDPARRHDAIKALGKAYTHKDHAKTWARNVDRLEGKNASTDNRR